MYTSQKEELKRLGIIVAVATTLGTHRRKWTQQDEGGRMCYHFLEDHFLNLKAEPAGLHYIFLT